MRRTLAGTTTATTATTITTTTTATLALASPSRKMWPPSVTIIAASMRAWSTTRQTMRRWIIPGAWDITCRRLRNLRNHIRSNTGSMGMSMSTSMTINSTATTINNSSCAGCHHRQANHRCRPACPRRCRPPRQLRRHCRRHRPRRRRRRRRCHRLRATLHDLLCQCQTDHRRHRHRLLLVLGRWPAHRARRTSSDSAGRSKMQCEICDLLQCFAINISRCTYTHHGVTTRPAAGVRGPTARGGCCAKPTPPHRPPHQRRRPPPARLKSVSEV